MKAAVPSKPPKSSTSLLQHATAKFDPLLLVTKRPLAMDSERQQNTPDAAPPIGGPDAGVTIDPNQGMGATSANANANANTTTDATTPSTEPAPSMNIPTPISTVTHNNKPKKNKKKKKSQAKHLVEEQAEKERAANSESEEERGRGRKPWATKDVEQFLLDYMPQYQTEIVSYQRKAPAFYNTVLKELFMTHGWSMFFAFLIERGIVLQPARGEYYFISFKQNGVGLP